MDEDFSTPVVDDAQMLRKSVQLEEMILVETTALTGRHPARFKQAVAQGAKHIAEDAKAPLELAVDVRRARTARIRPLDLGASSSAAIDPKAAPTQPHDLESAPVFEEDLDRSAPAPERQLDRLETWKSGPIALDEGRDRLGRERRCARLTRFVDGGVGVQERRAHEFGPGLLFNVDESLKFAQDMGVTEGVIDLVHPAIRQEMVVHDDAPLQTLGDVAALIARAVESEGQARRRVQPMQLAGDPIAGFVEMANPGLGHALANGLVDSAQLSRLLAHPGDEAGRTDQRGAEQIAQRLRGAVLGDQLLDVEIDRRRLDGFAILGRRDDSLGKGRSRFAATVRATMDRSAVFGHLDHALGKVEHLPLFRANHRTRVEPSATMTAEGCGVLDNPVGVGDLAKRIAPVALLTAARFARARAQAAKNTRLFLQSVA